MKKSVHHHADGSFEIVEDSLEVVRRNQQQFSKEQIEEMKTSFLKHGYNFVLDENEESSSLGLWILIPTPEKAEDLRERMAIVLGNQKHRLNKMFPSL